MERRSEPDADPQMQGTLATYIIYIYSKAHTTSFHT